MSVMFYNIFQLNISSISHWPCTIQTVYNHSSKQKNKFYYFFSEGTRTTLPLSFGTASLELGSFPTVELLVGFEGGFSVWMVEIL